MPLPHPSPLSSPPPRLANRKLLAPFPRPRAHAAHSYPRPVYLSSRSAFSPSGSSTSSFARLSSVCTSHQRLYTFSARSWLRKYLLPAAQVRFSKNSETVTCIVIRSTAEASVVIAIEIKSGTEPRSYLFQPRVRPCAPFRLSDHRRPRLRHANTRAQPARRRRV